MSNWNCTNSSTNEINLVTLDVSNNHDLLFGEEMEGEVANCFTKNTLLKQQHVCSTGNNFLNQFKNVSSLFF